jgi:FMN-dependent NADH-azoreductase
MSYTILHLDSSPMGDRSVSRKLTREVVSKLTAKYPDNRVIYHDLGTTPFPHLSASIVGGFFTPADQQSPEVANEVAVSDQLTEELLSADVIVVGAPMWNLSIPSSLKAWIDHVVRVGKTFQYTSSGAKGLISGNKKVIVVSSRGGVYTEGPAQAYDHQETYLRTIFGFLGISDVSFVRAEGVSMGPDALENALKTAAEHVSELIAAS